MRTNRQRDPRKPGRRGFHRRTRHCAVWGAAGISSVLFAAGAAAQSIPGSIFVLRGSGTRDCWSLELASSPSYWSAQTPTPAPVGAGGAVAQLWRFGYLFVLRGGGTRDFWRASLTNGAYAWIAMAPIPGPVGPGGSLTGANWGGRPNDHVYALQGGGSRAVYAYDANRDLWWHVTDAPGPVAAGGSLALSAWGSGAILTVILGGGSTQIWQYRLENDTWNAVGELGAPASAGTSMAHLWGQCYYILSGNQSNGFVAQPDPNGPQWCPEAGPLTGVPAPVGAGGSATAATRYDISPDDYVYAMRGAATRDVWRWTRTTNNWVPMPLLPHSVVDGGALLYVPFSIGGIQLPVQPRAWGDFKRLYR